MRETYEVGPGRTVTVTVEVTDAQAAKAYEPEATAEVLAKNYVRARQEIKRLEEELGRRASMVEELDETEDKLEKATRGHVCTGGCTENSHVAFVGRQTLVQAEKDRDSARRRVAELEIELAHSVHREAKLEEKVRGYDTDRHTERDRADQNKAWAERAEANGARLSANLVQAERERNSARIQIAELEEKLALSEHLAKRVREFDLDRQTERDWADGMAREVVAAKDRADALADRLAQAEKSLAKSRELVVSKNRVLNDKCDELRETRDQLTKLRRALAGAIDREVELVVEVEELTSKIDRTRDVLTEPDVISSRDRAARNATESEILARSIGDALDALA
jgi:chromosome segregation ATPase